MQSSFLTNDDLFDVRVTGDAPIAPSPKREAVRLLAMGKARSETIGSPRGVTNLIHTLHSKGFADVGAWSKLMPTKTPGEVMSVMTWYVSFD